MDRKSEFISLLVLHNIFELDTLCNLPQTVLCFSAIFLHRGMNIKTVVIQNNHFRDRNLLSTAYSNVECVENGNFHSVSYQMFLSICSLRTF